MNTPGRSCPLRYRYGTAALATATVREAETLYVIGGLYGNLPALDAIEAMAAAEPGPVRRVFNGDFNWFNVDPAGFDAVNRRVLAHEAILGNVEAELGADGLEAGCGCAYPAEVPEAVVQRSNRIHARLRATASAFPEILARLADLPMFARYRVGGLTVGVVHGDAESLAGWRFGVEGADDPAGRQWIEDAFAAAGVAVFASAHTCLPLLRRYAGGVLINNGAAGMPNFAGLRAGTITRIALRPPPVAPLYGTVLRGVHIDALPVYYDHERWCAAFQANWPEGSDAWLSYHARIVGGPAYRRAQAAGVAVPEGRSDERLLR